MSTATAVVYATNLPLPATVVEFFDTLREFGTIQGVDEHRGVTLYLPGGHTVQPDSTVAATDAEGSLGQRIRHLGQALGAKRIAPAFPTDLHAFGHSAVPTYRWEFGDAVYAGDGQWSILVPVTADLLHLLDTVIGLAGYDRTTYRGEPTLPVTYHSDETNPRSAEKVMGEDLRSIEDDLEAWFGEPVQFTDPQPVA